MFQVHLNNQILNDELKFGIGFLGIGFWVLGFGYWVLIFLE